MKIRMVTLHAILVCIVGVFTLPAEAKTAMSVVDMEMRGIRAAVEAYERKFGRFPKGDNPAVVKKLRDIGLGLTPERLTPDGSYLDPWGRPYFFLTNEDEFIVLSLGSKVDGKYSNPRLLVIDARNMRGESSR